MERYMFVRVHYDRRVASLEPLGLEYLMACVKAEKRQCWIHDEGIESPFGRFRRLLERIDRHNITVVGFSVMSNTAWYVLKLIKKLRRARPKVKIMAGGPEVVINYSDFLLDEIDYLSYDNGLDSFRAAVRSDLDPEVLKKCSGHAFRLNGKWIVNQKGAATAYCRTGAISTTTAASSAYWQRDASQCLKRHFPAHRAANSVFHVSSTAAHTVSAMLTMSSAR